MHSTATGSRQVMCDAGRLARFPEVEKNIHLVVLGCCRFEQIVRVGLAQAHQCLGFGQVEAEPGVFVLGQQNRRHPVVDKRQHAVGRGGNDGAGGNALPLRTRPRVIQSCEPKQLTIRAGNALLHLHLGVRGTLPLEECRRRNDTALKAQGFLKLGLFRNSLRVRIKQRGADFGVFRPPRNQPPAHQREVVVVIMVGTAVLVGRMSRLSSKSMAWGVTCGVGTRKRVNTRLPSTSS